MSSATSTTSTTPSLSTTSTTLHALTSLSRKILLSNTSPSTPSTTHTPFPRLQLTPKPILPPHVALTPAELALLSAWDDLRTVTHHRIYAEAWNELLRSGELEDEDEEDEDEDEERKRELEHRIKKLKEETDRLSLEANNRERVALAAVLARETAGAVFGVRGDAGVGSVVKSRTLRSLLTTHTALTTHLTQLHNIHATTLAQLTQTRTSLASSTATNRLLTTRLLSLSHDLTNLKSPRNITDPALRQLLEDSDSQLREARMRWETARNVVQGVVAGSGVDWVRSEEGRWRELVLKAGEEVE